MQLRIKLHNMHTLGKMQQKQREVYLPLFVCRIWPTRYFILFLVVGLTLNLSGIQRDEHYSMASQIALSFTRNGQQGRQECTGVCIQHNNLISVSVWSH